MQKWATKLLDQQRNWLNRSLTQQRKWINSFLAQQLGSYEENKDQQQLVSVLIVFCWTVFALILLLFIVDFITHLFGNSWAGTFGDFFGGVLNPILSAMTLLGLVITIVMQRAALTHARHESETNSKALQTQAFETTFFNMLSLHNSIVQELSFDPKNIPLSAEAHYLQSQETQKTGDKDSGQTVRGREVFSEVLKSLKRGSSTSKSEIEVYRELQKNHNYILGHYFRNLYQILKLTDKYSLTKKVKSYEILKYYSNILRAQLSSHELTILFMNCSDTMVDGGKFRELLIASNFLEHLRIEFDGEKKKLFIPGLGIDNDLIFQQYFYRIESQGGRWLAGAFGKNPEVKKFMDNLYPPLPAWTTL